MSRTNLIDAAFSEGYSYDNLNQLVGFTRGGHSRSWDYDAQGNWQSVTTNGSTQTRTHNAQNEITSISGAVTPTYDANGNLTKDETGRQFVYDAWNRLVEVQDASGNTLKTYTYDGLHRRVQETAGGTTTDLYYSDAWQVLEERIGGQTKVQYVWSPVYVDALILRDRDANGDGTLDERLYVAQDANYNVTALFDNAGNVVERYVYDPFGEVTVLDAGWNVLAASAFAWQYLHQGGRFDATSGLYHFRHRDYSPTLGRWTSLDPLRYDAGDVNLYRYVFNAPTVYADPNGLEVPGYAHMYPLYLGGSPDQVLFELSKEQHTAMHDYFREKGFGKVDNNYDEARKKWAKLTEQQRRQMVEEGMRRAQIPEHMIKQYIDKIMDGDKPGVNRSGERKPHKKSDISREMLDREREKAARAAREAQERAAREAQKRAAREAQERALNRGLKKVAKKGLGFIGRKFPPTAVVIIGYDLATGGPVYAFNEATWPLSELWRDD